MISRYVATRRRAVSDLGDILGDPGQGLEFALADDLVLDPLGTFPRWSLGRVLRRSLQRAPGRGGPILGEGLEVGHGVDAEQELHLFRVPGVEAMGLGEIRVAAEQDAAEPGMPAEQDGQVELLGGAFVRRAVAGAVDDAEYLAGVGQRDDQRVIAPGTVIGDVDALFTTGAGGDQRAVGIEDGLVEEVGRLLGPEFEPSLIEDVLEGFDVVGGEAAAEVARGGGVGEAVGAQGVEEDEVVASLFDVVEAGAVAQGIVGEVEDVVGLVVGEVELEQVEPLVNGFREAEVADQQLNPADAAARNRESWWRPRTGCCSR